MLIELEGISGSGKTTLCAMLKLILENVGHTATIVNEPDMTEMGTLIRKAIRYNALPRDRITEMFLALAVEAELHSQIIIPENAIPGHVVLRDGGKGEFLSRYYIQTRLSIEALTRLYDRASLNHNSVVSVLIDVPPKIAFNRIRSRRVQSKFDIPPESFLKLQHDVLAHIATISPNWIVINGTRPFGDLCNQLLLRIHEYSKT